jgi:hypothetical protein
LTSALAVLVDQIVGKSLESFKLSALFLVLGRVHPAAKLIAALPQRAI